MEPATSRPSCFPLLCLLLVPMVRLAGQNVAAVPIVAQEFAPSPAGQGPAAPLTVRRHALKGELMSWFARPTPAQLRVAGESREELIRLIADLNEVLTKGLPELYDALLAESLNPPARTPIAPVAIR